MLKYVLLALLARAEAHGYELRSAFEELMGGTWPLNIGQVYTALSRLEQDGLVECEIVPQDNVPDRKVYRLTERGSKELSTWIEDPRPAPVRLRDEVFLKVVLQETAGVGDALDLIATQRDAHIDAMAELTSLRAEGGDEATGLLLDGLILRLEADLKWLELCENRFRRRRH